MVTRVPLNPPGCLFRLLAPAEKPTIDRDTEPLVAEIKMKFARGPGSFLIYRRGPACYQAARREDYTLRIRDPITRAAGINSTPVIRARRVEFEGETAERQREGDRTRGNIIFNGQRGRGTRLIKAFCTLTAAPGCGGPQ